MSLTKPGQHQPLGRAQGSRSPEVSWAWSDAGALIPGKLVLLMLLSFPST